jgi:phage terminase large subunit GpA-like protein
MVCPECGAEIAEHQKQQMLRQGQWQETCEAKNPKTRGFHLNELYSPWRKWSEVVSDFLAAKEGGTETLKVWTNTSLGEVFDSNAGESVDETQLLSRREEYDASAPDGVLAITAGVDVQDNRLHVEVVGWGKGDRSWGLKYLVIPGDPSTDELWESLDQALLQTFNRADGTPMSISAACVDSGGHFTSEVYNFCRPRYSRRIFAIKGMAGDGRAIVSAPKKSKVGRNGGNINLVLVGVDEAKAIILSRLRQPNSAPGHCHFPTEYPEDYFSEITAEKRVIKYRRGFAFSQWVKVRPRNEAFDCRVYAFAALRLLAPNYQVLESQLSDPNRQPGEVPKRRSQKAKKAAAPRGSDWISTSDNWI